MIQIPTCIDPRAGAVGSTAINDLPLFPVLTPKTLDLYVNVYIIRHFESDCRFICPTIWFKETSQTHQEITKPSVRRPGIMYFDTSNPHLGKQTMHRCALKY